MKEHFQKYWIMYVLSIFCILWMLFVVFAIPASGNELKISKRWCAEHGGIAEYRLPDGARIDCLLPEYAIEFDYGKKWAESIGQALYYASQTQRKAAVILIIRNGDERYIKRLQAVAEKYNITIWYVRKP